MFNQNTIIKKESPFTKFKKQETNLDEFGFTVSKPKIENLQQQHTEKRLSLLSEDKIYTVEEIVKAITLDQLTTFIFNNRSHNGFIKLFSLKIDNDIKELVEDTINTRRKIVKINNLPDFQQRETDTEIKCQATEIPMSNLLRKINRFSKVNLSVPCMSTLVPEKDKPDYILNNNACKVVFDMKGQTNNRKANINKIAHDRAVQQGLQFYMIGVINSDKLEELDNVTYYLLPLNYMLEKAQLITTGKYQENDKNNYYSINIDNIVSFGKLFNK